MDECEILQFFDATIFSDEAGCRKPDKRIFQAAVAELGSTPERMIHIGDDPEADIWGAKQFGMRALLFDYPVPEEFKQVPTSLFALSRGDRRVPDSEIQPDARITSLKEALAFIDSLS
jgi:putative hydrolase of the HAD superfamily